MVILHVDNDQEMAQSERNSHFKNRRFKTTELTLTYTEKTDRKPSE